MIDKEDLKSFVRSLENGVGYIDNTDAFEYKPEDRY